MFLAGEECATLSPDVNFTLELKGMLLFEKGMCGMKRKRKEREWIASFALQSNKHPL
jgi:hypothetical protein